MGRKKIEIRYLERPTNRRQTFVKRARGLIKKAKELHLLSGARVQLQILDEKNNCFSFDSSNYVPQPSPSSSVHTSTSDITPNPKPEPLSFSCPLQPYGQFSLPDNDNICSAFDPNHWLQPKPEPDPDPDPQPSTCHSIGPQFNSIQFNSPYVPQVSNGPQFNSIQFNSPYVPQGSSGPQFNSIRFNSPYVPQGSTSLDNHCQHPNTYGHTSPPHSFSSFAPLDHNPATGYSPQQYKPIFSSSFIPQEHGLMKPVFSSSFTPQEHGLMVVVDGLSQPKGCNSSDKCDKLDGDHSSTNSNDFITSQKDKVFSQSGAYGTSQLNLGELVDTQGKEFHPDKDVNLDALDLDFDSPIFHDEDFNNVHLWNNHLSNDGESRF